MDVMKIVGVGIVTLIITIILKEYRRDFAIFALLIGGAIILYFCLEQISRVIGFIQEINDSANTKFLSILLKIFRKDSYRAYNKNKKLYL